LTEGVQVHQNLTIKTRRENSVNCKPTGRTSKSVPSLKAGDVVAMHGGRFEVLEDAVSVNCSPFTHGPGEVAVAPARCLSGVVQGYFWPGSSWVFQGNYRSSFAVEGCAGAR
jgi:hypothetical protein